jgi:hypothetical protein
VTVVLLVVLGLGLGGVESWIADAPERGSDAMGSHPQEPRIGVGGPAPERLGTRNLPEITTHELLYATIAHIPVMSAQNPLQTTSFHLALTMAFRRRRRSPVIGPPAEQSILISALNSLTNGTAPLVPSKSVVSLSFSDRVLRVEITPVVSCVFDAHMN